MGNKYSKNEFKQNFAEVKTTFLLEVILNRILKYLIPVTCDSGTFVWVTGLEVHSFRLELSRLATPATKWQLSFIELSNNRSSGSRRW